MGPCTQPFLAAAATIGLAADDIQTQLSISMAASAAPAAMARSQTCTSKMSNVLSSSLSVSKLAKFTADNGSGDCIPTAYELNVVIQGSDNCTVYYMVCEGLCAPDLSSAAVRDGDSYMPSAAAADAGCDPEHASSVVEDMQTQLSASAIKAAE